MANRNSVHSNTTTVGRLNRGFVPDPIQALLLAANDGVALFVQTKLQGNPQHSFKNLFQRDGGQG